MQHGNAIQLEDGWERIQKCGIQKVRSLIDNELRGGRITHQEFAALYTIVYQMCIQKEPYCFNGELYSRFGGSIVDYLTNTTLPAINADRLGEHILTALVKQWDDFRLFQRWLVNFFFYLNRFYVKRYRKLPLEDVCLKEFRAIVFENVKADARSEVLALIERDRNGEKVDRSLIRRVISIFVDMDKVSPKKETSVYRVDFERPFLRSTREYYSSKAAQWIETDSCPEYLRKAERALESELTLLEDCLHVCSKSNLMKVLIKYVLLNHQTEVLGKPNTGFKVMLQTDARDDIARVYNLYKEIPMSLTPIGKMLRDHILESGLATVQQFNAQEHPMKFVEKMLILHDQYFSMVKRMFQNNPVFDKALKDAFEEIINQKLPIAQSTAELLSSYSNALLSKDGIRSESEAALEETLEKIVRLFAYLSDKDLFQEFYRKALAKRLLTGRSANEDLEKSMIGKLKLLCGAQFTSKLEGMINDMRNASDHRQQFKHYLHEHHRDEHGMELDVNVLTTTYWPTYKDRELQLDQSMSRAIELFQQYYNKKTSNRVLKWVHVLGHVTVAANFARKRVYLEVSTIQACVLLVLNTCESISILNLHKILRVPLDEIKRQLKPLVNKKFKILNKSPAGGYDVSHLISVNQQCNPARKRIRIPLTSTVSAADRSKNLAEVQENRKHAIEASIVRIMKSRKTLDHTQLIAEVSAQLMQHFRPDPRAIKTRIEDLIGREYLERHPSKQNAYNYLA